MTDYSYTPVSYDLDRLYDWTDREKLRAIKKSKVSKQACLFEQGFKHRGYDLTLPDPNILMTYGGPIEKPFIRENDPADSFLESKGVFESIKFNANLSNENWEKKGIEKKQNESLKESEAYQDYFGMNETENREILNSDNVDNRPEKESIKTFDVKSGPPVFDKTSEYLTQRGIEILARDIRKRHRQLSIADSVTIAGMPITGFYSLLRKALSQTAKESLLREREYKIAGITDTMLNIVLDKTISLIDVTQYHFEKDLKKLDRAVQNKVGRKERRKEREAFKNAVDRDKKAMALAEKTISIKPTPETRKVKRTGKSKDKRRAIKLFNKGYSQISVAQLVRRSLSTVKRWIISG